MLRLLKVFVDMTTDIATAADMTTDQTDPKVLEGEGHRRENIPRGRGVGGKTLATVNNKSTCRRMQMYVVLIIVCK